MSEMTRKPDLILHYDPETLRPAAPGEGVAEGRVWLRMLNGEDDLAIQRAMVVSGGAGGTRIDTVLGERERYCRSVERMEGFPLPAGREAEAMDAETYAEAPRWALVKLRLAVAEMEAPLSEAALDSE